MKNGEIPIAAADCKRIRGEVRQRQRVRYEMRRPGLPHLAAGRGVEPAQAHRQSILRRKRPREESIHAVGDRVLLRRRAACGRSLGLQMTVIVNTKFIIFNAISSFLIQVSSF